MDIFLFKVAAILLIIMAGLSGGLVAVKIGVSDRGKRLLSLGNAFAGGIFLGAGLIHMLSDANEKFESFAGNIQPHSVERALRHLAECRYNRRSLRPLGKAGCG